MNGMNAMPRMSNREKRQYAINRIKLAQIEIDLALVTLKSIKS